MASVHPKHRAPSRPEGVLLGPRNKGCLEREQEVGERMRWLCECHLLPLPSWNRPGEGAPGRTLASGLPPPRQPAVPTASLERHLRAAKGIALPRRRLDKPAGAASQRAGPQGKRWSRWSWPPQQLPPHLSRNPRPRKDPFTWLLR